MTQEFQSGSMAFRPRARLLKLIGAELISDEVLAITELVKNAHDADASAVSIEFKGVTGANGEIVVRDDGHGMDLDGVLGRWMEPAGSSKKALDRRVTPKGRRVLGEKGVGRFAADKLGRHLELISRRANETNEVRAVFDWDEFDNDARLLSDVESRWQLRAAAEIPTHGTILRMQGLRSQWNERMFRRLSTRLSRLRSPFQGRDNFSIRIDSDEFPHYSGELRTEFLDRAPYRIDAFFDGKDTIEVSLNGSKAVKQPWNGNTELQCGPVRARLFAFDLETEAVARIGPRMEARAWLKEWSGVSLYRDGFRVWPYGEPHDDWLRLDQRRVNNPVLRLSNNQVVGFVDITRDGNPHLVDQTNREGLIQSPALEDLRRFMGFVFQILESERQSVRHPTERRKQGSPRIVTVEDTVAASLESLAEKASGAMAVELKRIAQKAKANLAEADQQRRQIVDGYSDLAAAGQAAIGVTQTVTPMLEELRKQFRELRTTGAKPSPEIAQRLRSLEESVTTIAQRVTMLAPPDGGNQARRRALDVAAELEAFRDLVYPILDTTDAILRIRYPETGLLRVEMRPESFHRVLYLLFNNSLEWLRETAGAEVHIEALAHEAECEIRFSDNGPGIPHEHAERVFAPRFSLKEGGRGMGLTIARDLLAQHGGKIQVDVDRRRRGANLRIFLPRKRSRATAH